MNEEKKIDKAECFFIFKNIIIKNVVKVKN
jgi:hypothetical protein